MSQQNPFYVQTLTCAVCLWSVRPGTESCNGVVWAESLHRAALYTLFPKADISQVLLGFIDGEILGCFCVYTMSLKRLALDVRILML